MERLSNSGKVYPKPMCDLLRNTGADVGTVINHIREAVGCPIRVRFLSDESVTVGRVTPLGRPLQPGK